MKEHKNPNKNKHSDAELRKQKLQDLERIFNMDLGSYLVLQEEGKENQIKEAKEKLRSHLLKYREEMKKEAEKLGGDTAQLVDRFLGSIESLLDHMPQVDPALLGEHNKIISFLEDMIKRKMK